MRSARSGKQSVTFMTTSRTSDPEFCVTAAADFALTYLRKHGPASSEVITDACKDAGHSPLDDRAFGAVYLFLSRRDLIQKHDHCQRRKGHNTAGGIVWAAVH